MFVMMAANMRLADTFAQRQAEQELEADRAVKGVVKQTRKPRWRTQLRQEMNDRIEARKALREAQDALAGITPPPTPDGAPPTPDDPPPTPDAAPPSGDAG